MIEIRPARAADIDEILECLRQAFEPYRAQYSVAGFTDTTLTRELLLQRLNEMVVLAACDDPGRVIGTVAFSVAHPGEGHLRGMAVRPQAQRSGVAQQLLARAERELRKLGCSRVTLDTTAPLQRAMRFYERNGYRPSGKVADFFGMRLYEYVKPLE